MGNDGGSIPTRRELVKEAARNPTTTQLKETQTSQQEYYWTTDPLSRKPLSEPIVSDSNGRLYNKESIIEHLLPSADGSPKPDHSAILSGNVASLRDVVEVKFSHDESTRARKCPITNDTLGPACKAAYLVPCGHAFSSTAIRELGGEKCPTCDQAYAANDVIPILPVSEPDVARLLLRAKTLKEKNLTHSLKKASKEKKRKKREEDEAPALVSVAKGKAEAGQSNNINNAATASLTRKVLEEEEARRKRRRNENVDSLFSSRDQSKPIGRSSDFMTRGFDIPAGAKR